MRGSNHDLVPENAIVLRLRGESGGHILLKKNRWKTAIIFILTYLGFVIADATRTLLRFNIENWAADNGLDRIWGHPMMEWLGSAWGFLVGPFGFGVAVGAAIFGLWDWAEERIKHAFGKKPDHSAIERMIARYHVLNEDLKKFESLKNDYNSSRLKFLEQWDAFNPDEATLQDESNLLVALKEITDCLGRLDVVIERSLRRESDLKLHKAWTPSDYDIKKVDDYSSEFGREILRFFDQWNKARVDIHEARISMRAELMRIDSYLKKRGAPPSQPIAKSTPLLR